MPNHSSQQVGSTGAYHDGADDADDHDAMIAALRVDLANVVADLKKIVEARASHAKDIAIEGAADGLDFARDTIRAHPMAAIAVTAALGAALAVALTSTPRRALGARVADWIPDVRRADLEGMTRGLQRSASSTGSSLLSAFERVVDSVSTIDPKSSLTPTLEKAAVWLSSLRGSTSGK